MELSGTTSPEMLHTVFEGAIPSFAVTGDVMTFESGTRATSLSTAL